MPLILNHSRLYNEGSHITFCVSGFWRLLSLSASHSGEAFTVGPQGDTNPSRKRSQGKTLSGYIVWIRSELVCWAEVIHFNPSFSPSPMFSSVQLIAGQEAPLPHVTLDICRKCDKALFFSPCSCYHLPVDLHFSLVQTGTTCEDSHSALILYIYWLTHFLL